MQNGGHPALCGPSWNPRPPQRQEPQGDSCGPALQDSPGSAGAAVLGVAGMYPEIPQDLHPTPHWCFVLRNSSETPHVPPGSGCSPPCPSWPKVKPPMPLLAQGEAPRVPLAQLTCEVGLGPVCCGPPAPQSAGRLCLLPPLGPRVCWVRGWASPVLPPLPLSEDCGLDPSGAALSTASSGQLPASPGNWSLGWVGDGLGGRWAGGEGPLQVPGQSPTLPVVRT